MKTRAPTAWSSAPPPPRPRASGSSSAAADAFLEHWYDDVTLASVAKRAGVSGQTVINHFGGKEAARRRRVRAGRRGRSRRRYTPAAGRHSRRWWRRSSRTTRPPATPSSACWRSRRRCRRFGRCSRAGARSHREWVRDHVRRSRAGARAGGGHRRLHLEAAAPRPGPEPRRDGGVDAANRRSSTRTENPMTTPKRYLFAIIDGGGTVPADTSVIRAHGRARPRRARAGGPRARARRRGHRRRAHPVGPRSPAAESRSAERDHEGLGREDARSRPLRRVRDGAMVGPGRRCSPRTCVPSCSAGRRTWWSATSSSSAPRSPPRPRACRSRSSSRTCSRSPGRARRRSGPGLKPARGPLGRARDAALNRLMARLFDKGLDRLNEVRRANGLEPRGSVLENFERADRLLLMTSRAFEYESFTPPPNVRIVGPRLDDPAWAGDWTPPAGRRPARAGGHELHVHGPRRRAAARQRRALGRAARCAAS